MPLISEEERHGIAARMKHKMVQKEGDRDKMVENDDDRDNDPLLIEMNDINSPVKFHVGDHDGDHDDDENHD